MKKAALQIVLHLQIFQENTGILNNFTLAQHLKHYTYQSFADLWTGYGWSVKDDCNCQ